MIDRQIKKLIKEYVQETVPLRGPVSAVDMVAILSFFGIVSLGDIPFEKELLPKITNALLECDAIIKGAFDTWFLSCQFIEWIGIPDPGCLHEDCHGVGCYK